MTEPKNDERTFTPKLKQLMVRIKNLGQLVLYVRVIGTNETSCVFLDAPILDRVKGVGGVGEDQVKDMEAVSQDEHFRCIKEREEAAVEKKKAMEPNMDDAPDPEGTEGPPAASAVAPALRELEGLTVKQLMALITLEDLDVDTKNVNRPVLIKRIEAARAGLPDPTKEPAVAG